MRSEENMFLVVAQRQMESCLQSVVRNLHLLRRNVLDARQRLSWPETVVQGLWQNCIMINSSHLHKTDKF